MSNSSIFLFNDYLFISIIASRREKTAKAIINNDIFEIKNKTLSPINFCQRIFLTVLGIENREIRSLLLKDQRLPIVISFHKKKKKMIKTCCVRRKHTKIEAKVEEGGSKGEIGGWKQDRSLQNK